MPSPKTLSREQLLSALAEQLQAPEAPNTKALKDATALFQKSQDLTKKAAEAFEQAMALLAEVGQAPKKNKPGAGRPKVKATSETDSAPSLFAEAAAAEVTADTTEAPAADADDAPEAAVPLPLQKPKRQKGNSTSLSLTESVEPVDENL